MTRSEVREGATLLFVALLEVSVIIGGKLSLAWAITVAAVYLFFLLAYVRGIVRRRRESPARGSATGTGRFS
ncbi:hypothetical protein ABTY98_11700 [Streptomyces sp. NPDC096040]|uniref:hypothetical protein n=1 Tax=Streptomyces sp. NPDC096040 TaxID=3155541 RepID=UPI0033252AD9